MNGYICGTCGQWVNYGWEHFCSSGSGQGYPHRPAYPYYPNNNKADLCPVCKGSGKYKKKLCHGCLGRGWVIV